jgi:hypothetical protein
MKKLVLLSFLCLGLCYSGALSAQQTTPDQQQQQTMFYYYPSSNVYYNPTTSEYWYYDDGSSNWVLVKELPSTITLVKDPSYQVYYNGNDVWKDNAAHLKKFKVNKKGKVKGKPKER